MASLDDIAGLGGVSREKAVAMFSNINWEEYARSKMFVTKEEVRREVMTPISASTFLRLLLNAPTMPSLPL